MTELLQSFLSGSAAWGVLLTLAAFALGTLPVSYTHLTLPTTPYV